MEGVSTTLLTTALFFSSLLPQASSSASFSPLPMVGQEAFRAVENNETLSDIAEDEYNDRDKVSVILEDNEWIENPDVIQPGWMIKIRKNPFLKDSPSIEASSSSEEVPLTPAVSAPTPTKLPIAQSVTAVAPTQAVTTVTPVATVAPVVPAASSGGPLTEEQITFLGNCEAGMNPTRNSGNGYYGAFQFSYGTWRSMNTGYERADLAPIEVQKDAVQRLLQRSSIWTQFPGCAAKMRASGLI